MNDNNLLELRLEPDDDNALLLIPPASYSFLLLFKCVARQQCGGKKYLKLSLSLVIWGGCGEHDKPIEKGDFRKISPLIPFHLTLLLGFNFQNCLSTCVHQACITFRLSSHLTVFSWDLFWKVKSSSRRCGSCYLAHVSCLLSLCWQKFSFKSPLHRVFN